MCSIKQLCICLIFFIILYNLEERKASIEFVIYGLIFTCRIRVRDLVQETERDCEPRTKATRLRTKCIFLGALSPLALLGKPTACSPCEGFQAHALPRWTPSLSLSTLFTLGSADLNPHPHYSLWRRFLHPMAGLRNTLFNKLTQYDGMQEHLVLPVLIYFCSDTQNIEW